MSISKTPFVEAREILVKSLGPYLHRVIVEWNFEIAGAPMIGFEKIHFDFKKREEDVTDLAEVGLEHFIEVLISESTEHTPIVTFRSSTGLKPPELRPENVMESLDLANAAARDFIWRVLESIK